MHAEGVIHRDIKPANLLVNVQPDGSFLVRVRFLLRPRLLLCAARTAALQYDVGCAGYLIVPAHLVSAPRVVGLFLCCKFSFNFV